MIKFFRQIRLDLMEKNKTGKYLKYAIGEIVLVVIGILIALQINNWNEHNKLKKEEIEILKNFKSAIESDLIQLDMHLNRYDKSRKSIDYLISYLNQDLPYKDSLKFHFGNLNVNYRLSTNTSIFENLKSKGFDLITNDSLKNEIVIFYGFAQSSLNDGYDNYSSILYNASETIYRKHFDAFWEPESRDTYSLEGRPNLNDLKIIMKPIDYEELKKDNEFMYFLKSLRNQQYWLINTNGVKLKNDFNSILELIVSELNK